MRSQRDTSLPVSCRRRRAMARWLSVLFVLALAGCNRPASTAPIVPLPDASPTPQAASSPVASPTPTAMHAPTATPTLSPTVAATPTLPARVVVGFIRVNTSVVHTRPDLISPSIGTMVAGQAVSIVGRDDSGRWLHVIFPPGSAGRGWILAGDVGSFGALVELPVIGAATDTPPPSPVAATPTPSPTWTPSPTATPTTPPTPALTAAPTTSPTSALLFNFKVGFVRGGGATVRSAPGDGQTLGTLLGGEAVRMVARDRSNAWILIVYPPESDGRGWVSATAVETFGGLTELPVAD